MTDRYNLSRESSDYNYDCLSHAGGRRRERNIPLDAVEHVIETGQAKDGTQGRVNFEGTWSGMTISVVVNPRSKDIVTTFTGTGTTGKQIESRPTDESRNRLSSNDSSPYRKAWK